MKRIVAFEQGSRRTRHWRKTDSNLWFRIADAHGAAAYERLCDNPLARRSGWDRYQTQQSQFSGNQDHRLSQGGGRRKRSRRLGERTGIASQATGPERKARLLATPDKGHRECCRRRMKLHEARPVALASAIQRAIPPLTLTLAFRVRRKLEDATVPSPTECNRRPPGSPASRPSAPGGTCARRESFRARSADQRGHRRRRRLLPAGARRRVGSPPRRLGSGAAPNL